MTLKQLAVAFLTASISYVPAQAAPKLQTAIQSDSLGSRVEIANLIWSAGQRRTPQVLRPGRFPRALQSVSRLNELSPEEKKELEKKALALVDDLVNEAMGLRLIENRIQVLGFAAEMLWKRDENRARGYLREAANQFLGMDLPPNNKSLLSIQGTQARQTLRTQLIQTIAEHDPQMALDFLRSSRVPVSDQEQTSGGRFPQQEYEKQFEVQLAIQIAENDPKMALQLAEETLKGGTDHQVVEIWRRLQSKDPKSAAKLAGEIVAKIKSADMMKNYGAASVINEMVFELRERIRDQKNPKKDPTETEKPAISIQDLEQSYRELLEIVIAAAIKINSTNLMDINEQSQARNVLTQAQSLLPDVEKYLPSRAAALRAKLSQFDNAYYHPPSLAENYEELQKKSSSELMAMAEKSKSEVKDMLFNQALAKALDEGDLELAKQISTQHLKGENDFMSSEIERLESEKALKEGKLEDARKTLDRLPSDAERALAIVRMAETVNDIKTQKELLGEAKSILGDKMDTRTQVESQLALAAAYLKFDSDYSFDVLAATIGKLNSVMSASIMLMKFTQELQADDEEMRFTQGGISQWFAGGFEDKIFAFARKDFARTQVAIARWQHYQTRVTMTMSLISMILGDEKTETRSRYIFGERVH